MSGQKTKSAEGVGVFIEDDERAWGDAALADDLVTELLLAPATAWGGRYDKSCMPLSAETASVSPGLLVVPSDIAGKVKLMPAWFGASMVQESQAVYSYATPAILLAHTQRVYVTSSEVPANSSGSTVYHACYAHVRRAATVTAARLTRTSDDVETSQTIDLADKPTLSFTLTAAAASRPAARALIPVDTTTAFYFPLAFIVVANGYTAGTAIVQSSSLGSHYIENAYAGTGIDRNRLRGHVASIFGSGNTHEPVTSVFYRSGQAVHHFGAFNAMYAGFMILPGYTVVARTVQLDAGQDWRYRMIEIRGCRMDNAAVLALPEAAISYDVSSNTTSFSAGPFLSGAGGTNLSTLLDNEGFGGAVDIQLTWGVTVGGALQVVLGDGLGAGADPQDHTLGDAFSLVVLYSPQFKV